MIVTAGLFIDNCTKQIINYTIMKLFSFSGAVLLSLLAISLVKSPLPFVRDAFGHGSAKPAVNNVTARAPKGTLSGTYNGNGFYTYVKPLTLAGASSCTWYVADVPNQISIKDANGNVVYSLGWRGTANYPGPWGQSLSTSNTFYFNLNAGNYTVYVDTVTNVNNGGSSDSWYIYY
ncbi:hypothetical protein CLV58_14916 [Spirosoma oryzae]|uniref:Uncharacterized protein n=1 Tax=Spirosoma oryzae TaxID=1469603 RepID=A0A2T0RKN3_9BACT|nr:hypothetical protein [Spirosoma oryzae]PRY21728.1 hypothetical protein CLV58_14916 [Spirosoma oryzae]